MLLTGCGSDSGDDGTIKSYHINSPDVSVFLPDTLHEISGLTSINSTAVACVQDEYGIIFIYEVVINRITNYYMFAGKGDYEGIAQVDSSMFVLRSDGIIFEIIDYESPDSEVNIYETGIPSANNEGLCYDADHDRLLIACKAKQVIYSFDLKTKKLMDEPAFSFDMSDIRHFAIINKIDLPVKNKKGKKNEPVLKFRTTEICIHPLTKELFLLSAEDHLLFIFDMNGKIEHIEQLDHARFIQAEGLTFFENGDMLISNEGQDLRPTLLRFNYKKN